MTTTETITLTPTGEPEAIRFRGRQLARRSNDRRGRRRWWVATIYEVEAPTRSNARYVVALRGCSAIPGESEHLSVQWFEHFRCPPATRFLRDCSQRGAHVVADAVREAGLLPIRDLDA